MKERYKTNSVVFLMLIKEENNQKRILLQLRQNTGYINKMCDMDVSGHVESNEKIGVAHLLEKLKRKEILRKKKKILN